MTTPVTAIAATLLLFTAACASNSTSEQHADAAATSAAGAAQSAGSALKQAGASVAEGAKSVDAAARPALQKAAHDAGPAVKTAASSAGSAIAAAGSAAGGALASGGAGNAVHGKAIFGENCAACHGQNGQGGGIGPSLAGEHSRKDFNHAVAWIKNPQAPMPKLYPSPLSAADVNDVAAYVESL